MSSMNSKIDQDIAELTARSERVGALRERVRIFEEVSAQGPTGKVFEMSYERLGDLINPPAE